MDVKFIDHEIDLRLNLLSGDSLFTENIEIKPYTIGEIKTLTYSKYMKNLGVLTLDKNTLTDGDKSLDKYTMIDLIVSSNNDYLIDTFTEALCIFLREDPEKVLVSPIGFIFNGRSLNPKESKIVNNENFNDIVQIVKYQNCMISTGENYSKPNPADEATKTLMERLKKAAELVAKVKENRDKGEEQNIDFGDIISAVSTKSNTYNKHNVWDLTFYQLYDEYKRLEAIAGYEFNVMAMMQGAKIDDLKHWSSKLDT